jgi:hypothetical protein
MTSTTVDHDPQNRSDAASATHGAGHGGHERPSYDDVNVPVIFLVGLISMILTFVLIWFIEGVYYRWSGGLVTQRTYEVTNTVQKQEIENQEAVVENGDADRNISSLESVMDDVVQRFDSSGQSPPGGGNNAPEPPQQN